MRVHSRHEYWPKHKQYGSEKCIPAYHEFPLLLDGTSVRNDSVRISERDSERFVCGAESAMHCMPLSIAPRALLLLLAAEF